jgi:hypothetical protein
VIQEIKTCEEKGRKETSNVKIKEKVPTKWKEKYERK